MKRLCAVLIQEQPKKNTHYLVSMLNAWEQAGVDTCLVARETGMGARLKVPMAANLRQVIQKAKAGSYEELILMTDDFMGPVYPLQDMLSLADAVSEEAWYLARGADMWGIRPSAWSLLAAREDIEGLEGLFREKGVQTRELYDTADLTEVSAVPMLDEPLLMARDRKCPFFLHMVFHRDYGDVITTTLGHQGQVFYRWLLKESQWDTDLLWDYLLPSCHQQDYFRNMHLSYILPTEGSDREWVKTHLQTHSLALVMHLYYPDKLKESCSFAERFPEQTHVIITTSDEEKKEKILQVFSGKRFASLDVRVIENRGRDVSSLLVGAEEVFDQYDYVCFFHDKKTLQTKPGSVGAGFAYKLQENLFPTKDFVNNVIRLFSDNRRLGILSPPPPHHGDYFFTLGVDWGPNYAQTKALADRLGFRAPIAPDRMPIAPLGTCFWFRGKALKPLSDHHWMYSEFPPEPNNADGTLLHAIERIYAFASVEAGYYPAFLLSNRYASIEYSNMRYYTREFNRVCIGHGFMGYQRDMCRELAKRIREK